MAGKIILLIARSAGRESMETATALGWYDDQAIISV